MRSNIVLITLCCLALMAAPALAKTPDGATPSEEEICSIYSGAAFGLCNAYCEAMDCTDPNQRAADRGCERVKFNFEKKTGEPLPCLAPPEPACPCVDEFQSFADVVGGEEVVFCSDDGFGVFLFTQTTFVYAGDIAGGAQCGADDFGNNLSLSPEDAEACANILRDVAEDQGLFCTSE